MAVYKRFSPNLLSAFSMVMMIAIWLAFAPKQAGGLASYIIVIGNSMEPKFHIGDLVIVHAESAYQVGDAIVYRNLELKKFVFHRIIAQEVGRYTLQGDNNSWVDTYEPTYEEVIGKLWLHIPKGGRVIQKLRSPFTMALIAGVVGAILATSLFIHKSKGNNHMNQKTVREAFASITQKAKGWLSKTESSEPQKPSNSHQGSILEGSFFALGLIALSSLILGIIAFSRPASRIAQDDISYEHLGVFSYSASTPQGVYDSNAIKSGDPIFTRLTCSVDVNFQYSLIAPQAENITGTYQLTAVISEPISGWQRVVLLQDEASFTGTAFGSNAKLNLCEVESLTQSMEQGTDYHPGAYTLVITPNVKLAGEVSGHILESNFNTGVTFRYDRVHFFLVKDEEGGNPLTLTETGILHEQRTEANTMLLFGSEIAIPALRLTALFGLIGSLSGLVVLGLKLQTLSRHNQIQFLRIRYDSMMIDIENAPATALSPMIDVSSMEALAKLAERFNAMILHHEWSNLHMYYVRAGGTTYRFVMKIDETEAAVSDASLEAVHQGDGS